MNDRSRDGLSTQPGACGDQSTSRGVTLCLNAVRGASSKETHPANPVWASCPMENAPSLLHIRGPVGQACTYVLLATAFVSCGLAEG